jgi:hypothetical protein
MVLINQIYWTNTRVVNWAFQGFDHDPILWFFLYEEISVNGIITPSDNIKQFCLVQTEIALTLGSLVLILLDTRKRVHVFVFPDCLHPHDDTSRAATVWTSNLSTTTEYLTVSANINVYITNFSTTEADRQTAFFFSQRYYNFLHECG